MSEQAFTVDDRRRDAERRLHAMHAEIVRRRQQLAAIAELGQAALTGVDVFVLLGQTCALVEETIGCLRTTITERITDDDWRVKATTGRDSTFLRCHDGAPEHRPLIQCAVISDAPVVFENFDRERRFSGRHWIADHGIEAGVAVPVPGRERLFGVMTCYSAAPRRFTSDEIEFLTSVAGIAGAAIESARSEEARKTAELARLSAEEEIERLAYRDSLTNLPNRFLFQDRVQHAIVHARRRGTVLAVMYLDLDRFKVVNDTLGHAVGDRLLQIVGRRLHDSVRADDTVARLGGDEFAVMLPEIERAEEAGDVARKILEMLRQPVDVDGHELRVTASIGISFFPGDGDDIGTLLRNADSALYRSKEIGRNCMQLFATAMNTRYRERLELELSLHRALLHDELQLVYQPLCDRETKSIRSFEALLRWNRNGTDVISPNDFIRLAEETRLIVPIGEWVLRAACRQLREWRDAGVGDFHVAVNLSAHQIVQPGFVEIVLGALRDYDLYPCDLELEVTETVALENLEWTLSVLAQLRALGVRIAVDDFGTGQSSLAWLKRLPLQTVKIDREFLQDIGGHPNDEAILSSIIHLGHSLNLYVIAEGIENEGDRALVESYGCDGLQGYLISRPLDAGQVPSFVQTFRYPRADA